MVGFVPYGRHRQVFAYLNFDVLKLNREKRNDNGC